ncbi:MAG: Crp/Fnr family transcriptional regulator [Pseudomonadales bacterium]
MTGSLQNLLADSPPFAYMDAAARSDFATVGRVEAFESGAEVFYERQAPDAVLVVLSGVVYICTYEAEGRRVIEAVLAPVESFGWLSLVAPSHRSLSAIAGGRTELMTVGSRDVMAVLNRHPRAWQAVARFLAERLRRTLASQRALAGFPLDRRIAFVLCQTFRIGQAGLQPLQELALSQEDIASMTATSRQSVNRQLRAWAANGLVALGYNSLAVRNPEALLRLALAEPPP